jgi:tRNA G18 (ribose-2'-O)-methylase SpoU
LFETIDHEDDPRLRAYSHVADPQWLIANGLFVAEGRLVFERLIEHRRDHRRGIPAFVVESVLLTPAAYRALETRLAGDLTVYVAPQTIVNCVTGFDFHRGCLALARRPARLELSALAGARCLVVLEGVSNPDNIGGVVRSAAALGAGGLILNPASGDPFYRKAIRTSMGAVLSLPFVRLSEWPDGLAALRKLGYTVAALTPGGTETIESFAERLPADAHIALLAGAEGPGLTGEALTQADATVRIPIDDRRDSLNVVVAVSIALHRIGSRLSPGTND